MICKTLLTSHFNYANELKQYCKINSNTTCLSPSGSCFQASANFLLKSPKSAPQNQQQGKRSNIPVSKPLTHWHLNCRGIYYAITIKASLFAYSVFRAYYYEFDKRVTFGGRIKNKNYCTK